MNALKHLLQKLKDRSGATVIEYCLIAGILALGIIGGATAVGGSTNSTFENVNSGVWGS